MDDPHGPKNWKKGHLSMNLHPFSAQVKTHPYQLRQRIIIVHGHMDGPWSTTTAENQPGAGKSGARLAHTGMHLLALLHKRENLTQNVKNSPGKPQKMLDETCHSHRDQRRMLKSKICSTKFEIEKFIFINSLILQYCSLLLTLSLCCLFCHPQQ